VPWPTFAEDVDTTTFVRGAEIADVFHVDGVAELKDARPTRLPTVTSPRDDSEPPTPYTAARDSIEPTALRRTSRLSATPT
jgi:hypothetical protein